MQRVLVIDDDPEMRAFVCELLAQHGYQVFAAIDGRQGIEFYERNSMDLVITDLFMPEKEGCETIAELKKRWPETKIIAMSGGSRFSHDCLPIARAMGAATLKKPLDSKELLAAVRKALAKS